MDCHYLWQVAFPLSCVCALRTTVVATQNFPFDTSSSICFVIHFPCMQPFSTPPFPFAGMERHGQSSWAMLAGDAIGADVAPHASSAPLSRRPKKITSSHDDDEREEPRAVYETMLDKHFGRKTSAAPTVPRGAPPPRHRSQSAGRNGLLQWINQVTKARYLDVPSMCDAVLYVQVLEMIVVLRQRCHSTASADVNTPPLPPSHLFLHRLSSFNCSGAQQSGSDRHQSPSISTIEAREKNIRHLQQVIRDHLPARQRLELNVERLAMGKLQDHITVLGWLHNMFITTVADIAHDAIMLGSHDGQEEADHETGWIDHAREAWPDAVVELMRRDRPLRTLLMRPGRRRHLAAGRKPLSIYLMDERDEDNDDDDEEEAEQAEAPRRGDTSIGHGVNETVLNTSYDAARYQVASAELPPVNRTATPRKLAEAAAARKATTTTVASKRGSSGGGDDQRAHDAQLKLIQQLLEQLTAALAAKAIRLEGDQLHLASLTSHRNELYGEVQELVSWVKSSVGTASPVPATAAALLTCTLLEHVHADDGANPVSRGADLDPEDEAMIEEAGRFFSPHYVAHSVRGARPQLPPT